MMVRGKATPCPIPRCALEWQLSFLLLACAVMILFGADMTSLFGAGSARHFRTFWSFLLGLPAILQIAALLTPNRALHRWTAFVAGMVSLVFAKFLFHADSLSIPAGVFVVQTLGELFVFLMLAGAKWSFSKNYSIGSPSNGSSAAPSS